MLAIRRPNPRDSEKQSGNVRRGWPEESDIPGDSLDRVRPFLPKPA